MANSKHRKDHENKLKIYKQKIKHEIKEVMNEQTQALTNAALPPIQSRPTWEPDADMSVKGFELEAIINGLNSVNVALQAAQSVMSRNILNGTITMDFEKLNPQTLQYETMSAEEKAPYVEASQKDIADFKAKVERGQNGVQDEAPVEQESASGLLDETGEPIKKQAKVVSIGNKS